MKPNVKTLLTGAVVSGLLMGGSAFANSSSKTSDSAQGFQLAKGKDGCGEKKKDEDSEKDSCSGKDGCGAKKDKKKKGDKDACSGKDGCGSK